MTVPMPNPESLQTNLRESFGQSFHLWCPRVTWLSGENPGIVGIGESSYLLSVLTRGEPVCAEVGDKSVLYLPIVFAHRQGLLAISSFPASERPWVERTARLFVRHHRLFRENASLEDQANASLAQMTADFEQHAFLRYLTDQIEICSVDRGIDHVIHKVLPRLQKTMNAEGVIFLPDLTRRTDHAGPSVIKYGTTPVDEVSCFDLAMRFDEALYRGPFVRNQGFGDGDRDLPSAVKNFMMVAVEKDSTCLGWIQAFNRQATYIARDELDGGFGTVEAGLLQVTAFMLAGHARNLDLLKQTESLTVGVVKALVSAIDARDSYTHGHSERVAWTARRIAQAMEIGFDECEQIYITGLLHDIGKIGVRDEVLRKPGRLTPEEFEEIQKHPEIGFSILEGLNRMEYMLPGVLYHHERMDGKGYPDGLVGDDIPLDAKILAVADAWDAMTSSRPYRNAMSREQALAIMRDGAGQQWDETVVEFFLQVVNEVEEMAAKPASTPVSQSSRSQAGKARAMTPTAMGGAAPSTRVEVGAT
jgi:HD-GYP domain-containing protein (c-di-GMP phosphodiesterase class II)